MVLFRALVAVLAAGFGMLLAAPMLVLGLPLLAVSLLTQVVSRLLEPRPLPWGQLVEFAPIIGWKPKAHLNAYHLVDDVFHVTTDAQGWRGKATLAESKIAVFGDSFAWGYGIDDKHFFANLDPQLPVKAIAAPGYNMVQELLWMRHYAPQLQGKLVVWFIYFGNDLYENVVPHRRQYRIPFVREVNGTGDWEMVTSHVSPHPWPFISDLHRAGRKYYEKLAELCCPTFFSHRAYSVCAFLVRQGRDICSDAGARLMVMTIPDVTQLSHRGIERLIALAPDPQSFDPDFPDKKISQICCNLGVPVIALKNYLKTSDHKEHDVHWNARGHQRVAQVLSTLLCSEASMSR